MAKQIEIDGIGTVVLQKRRGNRNIRLSIGHTGEVRVSLPFWAPYGAAVAFVKSKSDWIAQQKPPPVLITQGYAVGKAHHICFEAGSGQGVSTRITGNRVRVLLPLGIRWDSSLAQQAAATVGVRALKKEARKLLPQRLESLAEQHGYTYRSVSVRQLKGRWGSCSQHTDIVLNCFLMKLPWELIDYVLLHELAHTRVMAHGPQFWSEMQTTTPKVQSLRKEIKRYSPTL